jgi:hypothetical protein
MNRYIILAGCFITALIVAYFVRSEMLKKDIRGKVGESDQLETDMSKLTVFELSFLRDVADAIMESSDSKGLTPKLEGFAKDDKWKSIMAKTNGLKSFGLDSNKKDTTKSTTTTTKI